MRMVWVVASSLACALAGCTTSPYACSDASECVDGGLQGTCQSSGYCSFPDETCPSGQRYGEHAGGGFADKCVVPQPGETDTDSSSATSTSSTSSSGPSSAESSAEATSSPSSDDSTGACIPDCEGRACGPDGCGRTCGPGCGGDEACSPDGACEPGCAPWRVQRGSQLTSIHADDDGNLLITGDDQGVGLVARVSACDGDPLAEASFEVPGVEYVRAMNATRTGDGWGVVGQRVYADLEGREAFTAFLDPVDLSLQWERSLPAPMEEGWELALVDDVWWTAGVAGVTDELTRPWAHQSGENDEGCGFGTAVDPDSTGLNRALAVQAGFVFVGGSLDGRGHLAAFEPSACSINPCACTPTWSIEFEVADEYTEIRSLSIVENTIYAAGYAADSELSNDFRGFVVRVEVPVANVEQLWTYDPTPGFDGAMGVVLRDGTLYVPTVTSFDGANDETAQATLVALPADVGAAALWETELSGVGIAYDVIVDDDALYVVGRDATTGWVLRCTTDGDCPD